MDTERSHRLFSLDGKVAALTGGGGVLCGAIAGGYAAAGATVYLLDISDEPTSAQAKRLAAETGGTVRALHCNVLERGSVEQVRDAILGEAGRLDVLVNGAGGNHPDATTKTDEGFTFADLSEAAFRRVFDLNFMGTVLCSQVFGRTMADRQSGCIINISSMSGITPLTRIPAYSAAKAAVVNFTQWLAVDLAQNFSTKIRVNAIAPGFFHTQQNHFLLYKKTDGGEALSKRGEAIVAATPLATFGTPDDLVGAAVWLASDAARFVTGAVIAIDGGFSAYAGV
ncbi:MAG: SDR family oxidoreductase [Verrucomicrobia bacterium]|nr:SDR family oxidoreductase [Verrucomicrobiota bacterium]